MIAPEEYNAFMDVYNRIAKSGELASAVFEAKGGWKVNPAYWDVKEVNDEGVVFTFYDTRCRENEYVGIPREFFFMGEKELEEAMELLRLGAKKEKEEREKAQLEQAKEQRRREFERLRKEFEDNYPDHSSNQTP